jgi:hypothetical protein
MNSSILKLCVALLLFGSPSFSQSKKKAGTGIAFNPIEGYRPKTNHFQEAGLNTQIFTTQKQFDALFEKIPKANAAKIRFDNRAVLACSGDKTSTETKLSLEKISKKDGVLLVYIKAEYGNKLRSPMVPFCLYNIAADPSLSGVDYYINGKLVQELRN